MLVQQNSGTMPDWLFCNEVGKLPNVIAESMHTVRPEKDYIFVKDLLLLARVLWELDASGAGCLEPRPPLLHDTGA
jgi:hypothetical protein